MPRYPIEYSKQQTPKERLLLYILAAIQFTHCLDFLIILPLGDVLMSKEEMGISPAEFGRMTAIYSLTAAVVGFAAGFVMDRVPRRATLLVLYAGMVLGTFGCALAPSYGWLVTARAVTGMCGGVSASVVSAIVADAIPLARRGRGMAVLGAAFPVAQVLGMPIGLWLAGEFGWHAPFFFLGGVGVAVLALAFFALPSVKSVRAAAPPLRQMRELLTHPTHVRAFALSAVLLFAGALVAPFMAPFMKINGGLSNGDVSWMYFAGGVVVFFTTRLFGWLSDRFDKLRVLAAITVFTAAAVLVITHWARAPLGVTLVFTTLFFVTMSGRFAPAMSMVSNAIEARYRGGFMSVNAAGQQASASLAHLVAGAMITTAADGSLAGFGTVGVFSAVMFGATLLFAAWLRRAAPWAASNAAKPPPGLEF